MTVDRGPPSRAQDTPHDPAAAPDDLTEADRPGPPRPKRIEDFFVEQARRSPDRPAVLHRGIVLTYGALDVFSGRIANRLARLGVGPNTLVGLCMERSPSMIAAMLGILKAGGANLPLDPAFPAERLSFMLSDARSSAIVVEGGVPDGVDFSGTVLDLARDHAAIDNAPSEPVAHGGSGEDLAYVIYTSGSTGRPKGVMLAHSAANLIEWMATQLAPADVARIAASTSISFDPSIMEIFGGLGIGSLVILKDNALEPFTPDECPTMCGAPPSILGELARLHAIPPSARILHVGGEPLTRALVQLLFQNSRAHTIHNQYGPTEATTCATEARIQRRTRGEPTIGHPIAGAHIYLLDDEGHPVSAGSTGQIHIAGAGVALGYRGAGGSPGRFGPDPFVPGGRMFSTGDLGCLRPDGQLVFKGRFDSQVKLRGFRIELGEIEAALMRLTSIHQAAATVHVDGHGRDRLVAFVACDQALDIGDARRRLAQWLPAHMLPARIVTMRRLPLSGNGKIDRSALKSPFAEPVQPVAEEIAANAPLRDIVAAVFARHLGIATMAADQSLFDMGGDSIMAINVAVDLEALLGKVVSAGLLAHHPTPRAMATAIEMLPTTPVDVATLMQPCGHGPILFCAPDLSGRPLSFISLARRLPPPRRVVGLSPGGHAASFIERPDIKQMSRIYLDAARALQPAGPYIVCGYSFGAVQAFDLAALLESQGETVLLILIDGPSPRHRPSLRQVAAWLRRETPRTVAQRGIGETARGIVRTRSLWTRVLTGSTRRIHPREVPTFVPQADRAIARAMMQSANDWRPQPFLGPAALIRCSQPYPISSLMDHDERLGWRDLLKGRVECFTVRGTHTRIMQEPSVADLQAVIERATAAFLSNQAVGGDRRPLPTDRPPLCP